MTYDEFAGFYGTLSGASCSRGLTFAGHHHEIYLSDARRTKPAKLRTILHQPVKPIGRP